jgi:hypothetical protein
MSKLKQALEIWKAPKLSDDYHASTGYLSNSFIGDFLKCEYSAIIKHALKTESEFNKAFAVGHLVEALVFEGEDGFNKCLQRYGDNAVSKRDGKPLAWTLEARELAEAVLKQKLIISNFVKGAIYHQVYTFEFNGLSWRGEIDCLNLEKGYELDFKTTQSSLGIDPKNESPYESDCSWNSSTKKRDLTFIDDYNYHRQRALYQFAIKQNTGVDVTPYILAVSKTSKKVELFIFDDSERLAFEMKMVESITNVFKRILAGEVEPTECGFCSECVEKHVITSAISTSSYCANWRN